ncbi:ROK family protein [Patescibacteria group bacterium]|nr:ROK family protein [Patescibacteria group bacterium]
MTKHILGFDVGGTKISAVIGNDRGEILSNVRKPTVKHLGKKRLLEEFYSMGTKAMEIAEIDNIDAIGIDFAGLVDRENGIVVSSPNILGLDNFKVVEEVEKHFGVPTVLENDATAATIAERIFGSGKGVDNFVYFTLSTGIGGGAFLNGKLFRGAHGMAGEFGHTVIMSNGPNCGCGRKGCLEAIAGGKGIARRVSENISAVRDSALFSKITPDKIDAEKVFKYMEEGDMFAQLIIEETIYYLAVGIVNIINILDPEVLIIGGGISRAGKLLFDPLRAAVDEEFKSMKRPVKLVQGLENGPDLAPISIPLYDF